MARTLAEIELKCHNCGHKETHTGKSDMSAYNYAIQKYGWGMVGLDRWLCNLCWDEQPNPERGT